DKYKDLEFEDYQPYLEIMKAKKLAPNELIRLPDRYEDLEFVKSVEPIVKGYYQNTPLKDMMTLVKKISDKLISFKDNVVICGGSALGYYNKKSYFKDIDL